MESVVIKQIPKKHDYLNKMRVLDKFGVRVYLFTLRPMRVRITAVYCMFIAHLCDAWCLEYSKS